MLIVIRKRTLLRYAAAGLVLVLFAVFAGGLTDGPASLYAINEESEKQYIKWVDFTVPYSVLKETLYLDIKSYGKEVKLNWIELLPILPRSTAAISKDTENPIWTQWLKS